MRLNSLRCALLLAGAAVAAAQTGPVVAVTGGEIRGALTSDGGAAFKGVPFARPPVGDLRWREPQPVEPWTGVRDAAAFRPACPQLSQGWNIEDAKNNSEDCLYLNIAAPEWPPKKSWPVLYWIHGGSNTAGSGEAEAIDERALVRHGVIFVTVNYRLDALGFLAHPELTRESPRHASGNYGLMDQIAGLQWVRDNIAKFGGDPANVTIAGESAGALDVGLLMTSPLANGLFHRAIAESGAVAGFDGSLPAARAEEKGVKLAAALKAPAEGTIRYLRTLPPDQILKAARTLAAGDWTGLETSVDGWVLPEQPMQVFAEGRSAPVPLMTGSNAQETGQNEPAKKLQERIRKAYGPLADRALPFYQTADPLYGPPGIQWSTDYEFRCPSAAEALWHARAGAPTYEYEFEKPVPGQPATRHASELPFVFGLLRNTSPTEMDKKVADQVQSYWANFARAGDPNGKDLPAWPKFTPGEQSYLAFTAQGAAAKTDMRRKPCELFIEFRQTALPPPPYRDPRLTVEERASDLLKRMTLEEKAAELIPDLRPELLDTTGQYDTQRGRMALLMLGSPTSKTSPHDMAVLRNAVQRYRLEKTRLGIPQIFMGELLHGFMSHGATSFPQALALASTWDPALVHQVFTAAADEMSSTGVRQAFTPVLDLARDPRWGRTEETYGEDPYLASRIGVAAIEGMQGPNFLIGPHHVMSTAKHFAVHGMPEGGTNTAPGNYSERIIRESFLVPFQAAVEEAHAGSVMASYNEIDGIPAHVNSWLLDKVLRQEWGFRGYVTSDGGGLQMLVTTHHVAADFADAARQALAAGVDYDLSQGTVYRTVLDQVREGKIPEWQLDRAVTRVLEAKFRLGLFDNPYVDPDYAQRTTNSPEHRQLAEKTAEKAIVLLKNENNLLPLDLSKIKTIAVIGPNAADVHTGGYSRDPVRGVSILEGIRERVGTAAKVVYSEGDRITEGKQGWAAWYADPVILPDAASQLKRIAAAVEVARNADVAIVVVGENESTNREAWSDSHLGDRDSLDLIGFQDQLIKAIVETGKPTVVFLINGRPLSINYAAEHVPAILEGWYLGQEGGAAAARVLFGDVNPGGKLPITFPRSVGQIPAYYDHKPSMNRSYLFFPGRKPLFPFGWGLSYTTFRFDNLRLDKPEIGTAGAVKVFVDVTNTGTREGDEVAQLYIHQRVASVTRPVMELRRFERITLKPGEKRTVEFQLGSQDLSMLNRDMNRVVEPGIFDIMVGPSSAQTTAVALQVK